MEDLDTLRTLAKLIPEYCSAQTEDAITKHVYELIFAFDEVITIGYKETVTVQQIKTFTEMDSHEEKLQKIILESKINQARDEARQKAETIEKAKMDAQRSDPGGRYPPPGRGSGYGSGSSSGYGSQSSYGSDDPSQAPSGNSSFSSSSNKNTPAAAAKTPAPNSFDSKPAGPISKGMALSKGKKTDAFFEQLRQEEKFAGAQSPAPSNSFSAAAVAPAAPKTDAVKVSVEEQVVVSLERDGALRKMEVKGEMKVVITDPDHARLVIGCSADKTAGLQFRPHPKIDAKAWSTDMQLVLKDRTKPFPVGSDNATGILKWRLAVSDEDMVPLTVNFWPSSESGRSVVSVEFSMRDDFLGRGDNFSLHNLSLTLPCPSRAGPEVTQCDGEYNFSQRDGRLSWLVGNATPGQAGSFEFSIPEIDSEKFFPIEIAFTADSTFCNMQALSVQHAESGEDLPFAFESNCSVEKFVIE